MPCNANRCYPQSRPGGQGHSDAEIFCILPIHCPQDGDDVLPQRRQNTGDCQISQTCKV